MDKKHHLIHEQLLIAMQSEMQKFQDYYLWLENAMPESFFKDISNENIMMIVHNLMGFHLQEYFSTIHLQSGAIALCLDSPDADLKILKNYALYGIKNYETYVSNSPPPFPSITANLRIANIYFTEAVDKNTHPIPSEQFARLAALMKDKHPTISDKELNQLINSVNARFLSSLSDESSLLALEMLFRAKTRDSCQYEVRYNLGWEEAKTPSMQIVLAWKNTPKHNFLYRLARTIHRHGLVMKRVNAAYIEPYGKNSILVMALSLHGFNEKAAWEVADISDFIRDLVTLKYFPSFDIIDELLVSKKIISGNMGNAIRAIATFVHQILLHLDSNLYTLESIEEAFCRHPDLTVKLCEAFYFKFNPDDTQFEKYLSLKEQFISDVNKLDTGQEQNDTLRKNVFLQAMNLVTYTLKTNFFKMGYTSICFRLDPNYLNHVPFDRTQHFPKLPYAIFFMKGLHFFGFHIRFKDLARGGLRTVVFDQIEQIKSEMNNVFIECYHLALTQQRKNKDIPEGGAKGIIFLKTFDRVESEALILQKELEIAEFGAIEIAKQIDEFQQEQKIENLYQAQRSFIESLVTLVNCRPDGTLKAKDIVDYWKRPEYIYLGPDENMHDFMIQWIADYSKRYNYFPGSSFISSKPLVGINHKEFGVTSLGVNVYMEAVLKYFGIDPKKDPFTIKMSGGPDGDVAGNQIRNLYLHYPKTAKLLALTDASGTMYDPNGIDLSVLHDLFLNGKPLKFYPPELLSPKGFLLDRYTKKQVTPLIQHTLCWRNIDGKLEKDWISGSDMNYLFRHNVLKTKADIFIPAGGRPRTLSSSNVKDFLDETGKPTARAIIEGANLYLTDSAREFLDKLCVLIIKDSSANKTGVICSSYEVLCGLALGDEKFMEHKIVIVEQILDRLRLSAQREADLLLRTKHDTGEEMSKISDKISSRIDQFSTQILEFLEPTTLSHNLNDPLIKSFIQYCLPILQNYFTKELLENIPEHHKKAIIATHIAAPLVYRKGLSWFPSIVDILPLILAETE